MFQWFVNDSLWSLICPPPSHWNWTADILGMIQGMQNPAGDSQAGNVPARCYTSKIFVCLTQGETTMHELRSQSLSGWVWGVKRKGIEIWRRSGKSQRPLCSPKAALAALSPQSAALRPQIWIKQVCNSNVGDSQDVRCEVADPMYWGSGQLPLSVLSLVFFRLGTHL